MNNLSIIILNGWGLSSGWGGNAIASAVPVNFLRLWNEGMSRIIKPRSKRTSQYFENGLALAEIFSGKELESIKEITDKVIRKKELGECLELKKSLENCKSNTSSLNLIATISENDEYCDIHHILSLVEILKIERMRNINFHLILRGEMKNVSGKVEVLANILNTLEDAQITSIQGSEFIRETGSKDFIRSYSAIVSGVGEKALDVISILSKNKNIKNADLMHPYVIYSGNNALGRIYDFDSIISLDFDGENINNFIKYLGNFDVGNKIYKPMGIRISTLTDYDFGIGQKNVGVIIEREEVDNCVVALAQKTKIKCVGIFGIKNSWIEYYIEGFEKKNQNYLNCVVIPTEEGEEMSSAGKWISAYREIANSDNKLIINYFTIQDFIKKSGSIKENINSIKIIDSILGKIVNINLDRNYQTIIIADTSGLESNGFKGNPLPFIYVKNSDSLKDKNVTDQRRFSIEDLLGANESFLDIAPSICKALQIELPNSWTGKSLI